MTVFHDRRTGQHLEIHGGGYFAKPKAAATLPGMARRSSEPVDSRAPGLRSSGPDPLSSGGNRGGGRPSGPPTAQPNPARKPDPFKARRAS